MAAWQGHMARWWLADWAGEVEADGQDLLRLCTDKPGGTTGERDKLCSPGFQHREIKSIKTFGFKNLWGLGQWEKLPISQESLLERSMGSQNIHKPTSL